MCKIGTTNVFELQRIGMKICFIDKQVNKKYYELVMFLWSQIHHFKLLAYNKFKPSIKTSEKYYERQTESQNLPRTIRFVKRMRLITELVRNRYLEQSH